MSNTTTSDSEESPAEKKDPFEGLVLDDAFVDAAETTETTWRPAPEPKRRFFGRKPKPSMVRAPRRRRFRAGPWQVLIAVVLVLIALNPGAVKKLFARSGTASTPTPIPTVTFTDPTASPSASPTDDPDIPTLDHPFAGSPAASWASGADAIVLPAARAYGNVSTARVAANLQRVKEFLVETNLDASVLSGATPTAALNLLDPQEQDGKGVSLSSALRNSLVHPSADNSPLLVFSRFDPKQALVIGGPVKVSGQITLGSDGADGTRITTDYTFVYALRSSASSDAQVARTIVRRVESFDVLDIARYVVTPGTLMLHRYDSYNANGGCDDNAGYLIPQFVGRAATSGPTPSGTPMDPYDRSKPLDTTPGCGTVTRT